jgi:hypothetical protein
MSACSTGNAPAAAVYDFDAIRTAHPLLAFVQNRGVSLQRHGGYYCGKCPLHNEQHGESFVIYPAAGRWHCFGLCAAGGDVADLLSKWDNLSLKDAARLLAESSPGGIIPSSTRPAPRPAQRKERVEPMPYCLTSGDRERMAEACHRLAGDPALIERLCEVRPEWSPEAVRGIALEGDLGFDDGTLLFGYRFGVKRRGQNPDGSRRIKWDCGGPHGECWRQSLLLRTHHTVYVTEGESDCLSVISLGVEEPGEALVVALASATSLPKPEPFKGKHLILVPDDDKAGENCVRKLFQALSPVAASVKVAHMGLQEGVTCG